MLPIQLSLPEGFLDNEIRNEYLITSKYKELWAVELDLLSQLDRICQQFGLRYYACAGTMLGAVRHNGIIPWDDDVDVMMPRCDYDTLCEHGNDFGEPYFLQTEYNDRGTLRGHAQLRNSKTTGILEFDKQGHFSFNQGIFIDIFSIDNLPNQEEKCKYFIQDLKKRRHIFQTIRDFPSHIDNSAGTLKRIVKSAISPIIKTVDKKFSLSHRLYIEYENKMKSYNVEKTNKVGILSLLSLGNRFIWNADDFEGEPIYFPFEFLTIPVPNGYSNILRTSYGKWEECSRDATNHGGLLFDAHRSYTEYL